MVQGSPVAWDDCEQRLELPQNEMKMAYLTIKDKDKDKLLIFIWRSASHANIFVRELEDNGVNLGLKTVILKYNLYHLAT